MIELEIIKIEGCDYYLKDNNSKKHRIKFEIIGKEYNISKNDTLYISKKLLNDYIERIINFYCFGPIKGKYNSKKDSLSTDEIMVVKHDNKKIYLQRYYG